MDVEEWTTKTVGALESGDLFKLDSVASLAQRVLSTERDSSTDTVLIRYREAGLSAMLPMCIRLSVFHLLPHKTPAAEGRTLTPREKEETLDILRRLRRRT